MKKFMLVLSVLAMLLLASPAGAIEHHTRPSSIISTAHYTCGEELVVTLEGGIKGYRYDFNAVHYTDGMGGIEAFSLLAGRGELSVDVPMYPGYDVYLRIDYVALDDSKGSTVGEFEIRHMPCAASPLDVSSISSSSDLDWCEQNAREVEYDPITGTYSC